MDTEYGYSPGYSRNPMATGAIVLGVISLVSFMILYISVPCGAMAVLLAILSHGKKPMPGRSKAGIACGLSGICLSVTVTLASMWIVLTNPQMRAYMERYMQYYLGDSSFDLDSELGEMFPGLKGVLGLDGSGTDEASPSDDLDHIFDELFPLDGSDVADDGNDNTGDNAANNVPAAPSGQHSDREGDFI